MDILFRTDKLLKACNSLKTAQRQWGTEGGKLIMRRLDELRAAVILEDMRKLPQARCHELVHNRSGQLSVDLKHPYRLIFRPAHDPVPRKPDGGLDWTKVTAVEILDVEDTHGH